MLKNDYLLAKIGVDPAENEPSKVCLLACPGHPPGSKKQRSANGHADPAPGSGEGPRSGEGSAVAAKNAGGSGRLRSGRVAGT